jgi:hypothetical protein
LSGERSNIISRKGLQIMILTGSVKGGKILLPEGITLPDGMEVRIEVPTSSPDPATAKTDTGRRLLKLAGTCDGLPEDLSVNLDHYLYGTPKQ